MTDPQPEQASSGGAPLGDRLAVVVRGALLVAVLIFVGLAIRGEHRPLEEGAQAPALPLVSYDGKAWDLSRFEGRPIVVNFWGTWCPPCLAEMPHFARAARAYGDDVVFIGASVNSPAADVFRVIERFGVTYPIAQVDGSTSAAWNARSLPSTYFLDAEHRVVWSTTGAITGRELDNALQDRLGLSPPPASDG